MADLIVCPFALLNINGKEGFRPRVALYSRDWSAIADIIQPDNSPRKSWCLAVVDAWDNLAAAQADNSITFVPKKTLTGTFTAGERTAINNRLAAAGIETRATASDDMSSLLTKLGAELNQTIEFDPAKFIR